MSIQLLRLKNISPLGREIGLVLIFKILALTCLSYLFYGLIDKPFTDTQVVSDTLIHSPASGNSHD